MNHLQTLMATAACPVLAACGGGDSPDASVSFVVRLKDLPATEEFRVSSSSPQFIAQARAQLSLPPSERRLFITGGIGAGDGGHNPGWNWHFSNVALVETAIELCDGRPSMVEADLNYWLNTVKSFCPWDSYVYSELAPD